MLNRLSYNDITLNVKSDRKLKTNLFCSYMFINTTKIKRESSNHRRQRKHHLEGVFVPLHVSLSYG